MVILPAVYAWYDFNNVRVSKTIGEHTFDPKTDSVFHSAEALKTFQAINPAGAATSAPPTPLDAAADTSAEPSTNTRVTEPAADVARASQGDIPEVVPVYV